MKVKLKLENNLENTKLEDPNFSIKKLRIRFELNQAYCDTSKLNISQLNISQLNNTIFNCDILPKSIPEMGIFWTKKIK